MNPSFAAFKRELAVLGLTQIEFARMVDTTPQRVCRWNTAKRGVPGWVASWLRMYRALPVRTRYELLRGNSK